LEHRVEGSAIRAICLLNRVRNKAGRAFAGEGLVFDSLARAIFSVHLECNNDDRVSGKAAEGFCMMSQRLDLQPCPKIKGSLFRRSAEA
jgi:hypothetical protein